MYSFKDYYEKEISLSFEQYPFSEHPKHIWVILRYKNDWVLTKHKKRGLEFPGGKVEQGESLEQAVKREVMEETGGQVGSLHYVGTYKVHDEPPIIKAVFYAELEALEEMDHYFETAGPEKVPDVMSDRMKENYSFIMKDDVLVYTMNHVREKFLKENGR